MATIKIGQLQFNNVVLEDAKYQTEALELLGADNFRILSLLDKSKNKILGCVTPTDAKGVPIPGGKIIIPCPPYCFSKAADTILDTKDFTFLANSSQSNAVFDAKEIKNNFPNDYFQLVSLQLIPTQVMMGFVQAELDETGNGFKTIDLKDDNLAIVIPT